MFRDVPCSGFYRRPCFISKLLKAVGTWNIPEHPGTFRNIPEHGIIIIIMKGHVKLSFQQLNETKINWYQLGKLKEEKNRTRQNKEVTKQIQTEEKKRKMKCVH